MKSWSDEYIWVHGCKKHVSFLSKQLLVPVSSSGECHSTTWLVIAALWSCGPSADSKYSQYCCFHCGSPSLCETFTFPQHMCWLLLGLLFSSTGRAGESGLCWGFKDALGTQRCWTASCQFSVMFNVKLRSKQLGEDVIFHLDANVVYIKKNQNSRGVDA